MAQGGWMVRAETHASGTRCPLWVGLPGRSSVARVQQRRRAQRQRERKMRVEAGGYGGYRATADWLSVQLCAFPFWQVNPELTFAVEFHLAAMYHLNKNYREAIDLYTGAGWLEGALSRSV